ncbi:hypothetical protein ACFQ36_20530 [Arthrobacter sp. GCM10027362]|uniref:hypothetical protein n=1 Tax=Arthrobacter sp. GCM10027362 TaxID=3273379 RepID=UPI00363376D9
MTNPADEPTALPEARDADRFEQQMPVAPDEIDEGAEADLAASEGSSALPGGSEADRMEQIIPDRGPVGLSLQQPGQSAAEGSEADRLEQATGIPGLDEDDYPHDSEG